MKKFLKIMGFVCLGLVIVLVGLIIYIKSWKIPEITVNDVDLTVIQDGLYTGTYSAFPVKVTLDVEVQDHRITNITIKEHQNGQGKKAEDIITDIIERQTLNIDVISGATLSSNVIRKAVEEALN